MNKRETNNGNNNEGGTMNIEMEAARNFVAGILEARGIDGGEIIASVSATVGEYAITHISNGSAMHFAVTASDKVNHLNYLVGVDFSYRCTH